MIGASLGPHHIAVHVQETLPAAGVELNAAESVGDDWHITSDVSSPMFILDTSSYGH
jgi:hypothetical protein